MLLYGYFTLFSSTLPVAPFLACGSLCLEIKVDAFKYSSAAQRPYPEKACDMGIWFGIKCFVSLCAIVTNLGLIVITDNRFGFSETGMWSFFILIEHCTLIGVFLLTTAIPDESAYTTDMKRRHAVVVKTKYMDKHAKKSIANKLGSS